MLLSNAALEKSLGKCLIMQKVLRVGGIAYITIQGHHVWIGMSERLQGHTIGLARRELPFVQYLGLPKAL